MFMLYYPHKNGNYYNKRKEVHFIIINRKIQIQLLFSDLTV